MKTEPLAKVQFWITPTLKQELNEFAHSLSLATADLYKAGATMLMQMLKTPSFVSLNLYTKTIKDLQRKQIQKDIRKAYQERGTIWQKTIK